MWNYDKKLQYPINIKNPDPKMAGFIISQYGGPDGELGATLRYLSQRFSMPTEITKATLNDIGTEEIGHLEMVGTMVHQLTKGVCPEDMEKAGLGAYYTDHGISVYPQSAGGMPFNAAVLAVKGDPITDLTEDMAAEQKARTTYEYLIDLADDPDVIEPLKYLREREVVHFQRFGEALRTVQEKLAERKFYMNMNNSKMPHPQNPNTTIAPCCKNMNSATGNTSMDNSCKCMNHNNACGCKNMNANSNCNCKNSDNNCGCNR